MFFLLLLCVFFSSTLSICPPGSNEIPNKNKCVIVGTMPSKSGYFESQRVCEAAGGNLMSVGDEFTNTMLFAYTVQYRPNATHIFLGMDNHDQNTWKWIDGSNSTFRHWASGQPSGRGDCAAMRQSDGLWYTVECVESLPYFCEVPPQKEKPLCEPGWAHFSEACYYAYSAGPRGETRYSFTNAQAICVYNGGNLVSIHGDDENRFVVGQTNSSTSFYWIGLYCNGTMLLWTDGSPVSFLNTTYPPENETDVAYTMRSASVAGGSWMIRSTTLFVMDGFICKKSVNASSSIVATDMDANSSNNGMTLIKDQHFFIPKHLHLQETGDFTKNTEADPLMTP